ncbi:tRNA(Ile)(2)-agmatinylcytidine synthase [Halovivax limisalsi]|uniref:tRNA(Ile)(2)-agmatinylcytidine synthase n=1 Tax=Halovivax limisalsi TaxID=1453760 RepID=UPI001FFCD8ED|nr:tRNA(Ile)(2)-agmatinylcytidine synthase [Halovivax limisalsi]
MTIVGLDDTDSRENGMCTTYVGARLAERLRDVGTVDRLLLVRLNPAVEYKTRGNAAVAVQTSVEPERAFELAAELIDSLALASEPNTNPGVVVAPHRVHPDGVETDGTGPAADRSIPDDVSAWTVQAIRGHCTIADAERRIESAGYRQDARGNGRGRIGALAAVGAQATLAEWTYERIAYRTKSRRGTDRSVDAESVFDAANAAYPTVWDTVDRGSGELVCVPRTPGPVLVGIRGDDPAAVDRVLDRIEAEPVAASERFLTNQGTDVHLREGRLGALEDGRAYRVDGVVDGDPETRRGGHVFVPIVDQHGENRTECAAFEPTKRFRDRVRALRPGDRVTVCGERSRGTIKLEKFAVRELESRELVTPTCPSCDRTMESAGRDQGYRCRDCGTSADGRERVPIDRALESGWYEVPPRARRHVAKPLVRGGFDGPTHPER